MKIMSLRRAEVRLLFLSPVKIQHIIEAIQ